MQSDGQLGLQLQDAESRGTAGRQEWRREGAQGQKCLTVTLDNVAAAVADIPKELWTKQVLNMQAVMSQPRARAVA